MSTLPPQPQIAAICVNHNTSCFTELLLRSLRATHPPLPGLSLTVYDNASTDDTAPLRAYAQSAAIAFEPTGLDTKTLNNSHGQLLDRFILAHPQADYYLLLDADVCFVQPDTIGVMLHELQQHPIAFGVGVRQSWDGRQEVPLKVQNDARLYDSRLHPCCALVPNTDLFRRVVAEIGLGCYHRLHAAGQDYLDTAALLTRVMALLGHPHRIAPTMVLHFFNVSYDPRWLSDKQARCARLLDTLRRDDLLAFHQLIGTAS